GGYPRLLWPSLLVNFLIAGRLVSVASHHIVFNSARDFSIKRLAGGDYLAGSAVMGFFTLRLDGKSDLRSVDGIGTSWNIMGSVVPPVNMDSTIAVWVAKDIARPH